MKGQDYLTGRGISMDEIAIADVMFSEDWIGFPYRDRNGTALYRKWRKIDKSDMRIKPSGIELIPFSHNGEFWSATGGDLVITEGEIDALTVGQTCFIPVISVPNGAPAREGQGDIDPLDDGRFAWMWDDEGKLIADLDKFQRFVLMTDNDPPGKALASELSIRLGRDRCYIPTYPRGCKDANDVLIEYGDEALPVMIRTAKPLVPPKLMPYSEIAWEEEPDGISSGAKALDRHLRLTFPELVTVTGVPNAGKSQWTLWYVCQLARLHDLRISIMQFEDSPARNARDIRAYAEAWKLDPEAFLDRHFRVMRQPDVNEDITLDWVAEAIRESACIHGSKIIVIDPWNEIEHAFSRSYNETQYTNEALRKIKALSRQYQVAVIIVAHPAKGITQKSIEELTLYEVSGSAAWNNKSDHGIIVYREDGSAATQVKIAKCKTFDTMGVPGIVSMNFDSRRKVFENIQSLRI